MYRYGYNKNYTVSFTQQVNPQTTYPVNKRQRQSTMTLELCRIFPYPATSLYSAAC